MARLSVRPPLSVLTRMLFGNVSFSESEEDLAFRYKLLILLMVSGAFFTALFIVGTLTKVNPIGWPHFWSMCVFTSTATVLWLCLRNRPRWLMPIAWTYEIVGLLEYTSSAVYVPSDELRVLWFYVNVPGTFIILGATAGWCVTIGTVLGFLLGNAHLDAPYSPNALATGVLSLLYLGVFFHAYVDRSLSYFHRMQRYNVQLRQLASHDPLTGLMNARAYYAACDHQIHACARHKQPYAVLFVDLDHFKRINDTYGHAAGDEVLKVVANTLTQQIRRSDLVGRIGGEEFSIFLPHTDQAGAIRLAESLRLAIERAQPVVNHDTPLTITASIGVACGDRDPQPMQAIQQQADVAMYQAKKEGRNRVSSFAAA